MITIRQIEAFKAVIETGTVVKAAESMLLSQPAVSRLLADLEAELGYTLFDRRKGRLAPRAEAEQLYGEVERSFTGLQRIDQMARRIGRRVGGRLRILSLPVYTQAPLPRVTTGLLAERGRLWINVQTRPPDGVVEGIAAQQFDLGLTTLPFAHLDVQTALVARVPFDCILHPDHPLATRPSLTVEDVKDIDFIAITEEGSALPCAEIIRVFRQAGSPFRATMESSTMAFACRLVANGIGAIFGPQLCIDELMRPHLRAVPFKPEISADIAVIHAARQRLGLPAKRFLAAFTEAVLSGGGRIVPPPADPSAVLADQGNAAEGNAARPSL